MSENYQFIAKVSDIRPNEMERFDLNGRKILICHSEDKFYALDDTCSHEEASLYRGSFKNRCVTCPMHGSRFDIVSGKPLDEPATESVATHNLKIEGDDILISIRN